MVMHPLAGLEPASVFCAFEEICAIPHGSGNTKAISDYLVKFAEERHLRCRQDESNNVIIWKDGTPGYENHSPVILQGHMDMVCEKDPACTIDMEREGLDLTHDETDIFARGTTLGGDDGIAVAYALAILDSDSIPHPPLEILITVDEEIGMLGAAAVDLSDLEGRTLLNLDSEEEGILTVSCAGGARAILELPVTKRAVYGPCLQFVVDGLQGGHSGAEIHKNRANANKVMGELLSKIQEKMPLCIVSMRGGAKDNAIPRSCRVKVVAMSMELDALSRITEELQADIRSRFDEPEAVVTVEEVDALGGMAMGTEDSRKAAALLQALPNGIQSMSTDIEGLVQTSLNLGVAKLEDSALRLTFSVRSSVNGEKDTLLQKLQETAGLFGCGYSQMGEYPAWEYRKNSPLRDTMVAAYRDLYKEEPQVAAIHAGLECGLLSDKLPGLDCVSCGPQMHDIHTSREKLNIASVERTWKYVLEILKRL